MLNEILKRVGTGFPISFDIGNGVKVKVFNERGFDRKGYAVYIWTGTLIPHVGIGSSVVAAYDNVFFETAAIAA